MQCGPLLRAPADCEHCECETEDWKYKTLPKVFMLIIWLCRCGINKPPDAAACNKPSDKEGDECGDVDEHIELEDVRNDQADVTTTCCSQSHKRQKKCGIEAGKASATDIGATIIERVKDS